MSEPQITDDPDYFPNTDYERGYADGRAAAIEEEARTVNPEGLDVERLARAIVTAVRSERAPIGGRGDGWPAYWEKGVPATVLNVNRLAAAVAAEYARLRSEGTERSAATPSSSPRTPTDG